MVFVKTTVSFYTMLLSLIKIVYQLSVVLFDDLRDKLGSILSWRH